jgi:hypothetical protein
MTYFAPDSWVPCSSGAGGHKAASRRVHARAYSSAQIRRPLTVNLQLTALRPNEPGSGDKSQDETNTNLEQVSDWLTKIIVGVGLTQIGRVLPALTKLSENLKAPLGGQPSSGTFGLALTISYTLLGFLFFYLWSRTGLHEELRYILSRLSRRTSR